MKFEKGNTYGSKSSRKGTPNKANFKIKNAIADIVSDNIETLQNDIQSMKPVERVNAILQLLKYVTPTLRSQNIEVEANVNDNTELINRLFELPNSDFEKLLDNE